MCWLILCQESLDIIVQNVNKPFVGFYFVEGIQHFQVVLENIDALLVNSFHDIIFECSSMDFKSISHFESLICSHSFTKYSTLSFFL